MSPGDNQRKKIIEPERIVSAEIDVTDKEKLFELMKAHDLQETCLKEP